MPKINGGSLPTVFHHHSPVGNEKEQKSGKVQLVESSGYLPKATSDVQGKMLGMRTISVINSKDETGQASDIRENLQNATALNDMIGNLLDEGLVTQSKMAAAEAVRQHVDDLLEILDTVRGSPEALQILQNLEKKLENASKKPQGFKGLGDRLFTPRSAIESRKILQKVLSSVENNIKTQPAALEGRFAFSASPEAEKEFTEYFEGTLRDEYQDGNEKKGVSHQFVVDVPRQHMILKEGETRVDSALIKQQVAGETDDKMEQKELLEKRVCQSLNDFLKGESGERIHLISQMITQTPANAMAAGLVGVDFPEITGQETPVSFTTKDKTIEVERQDDGTLCFDCTTRCDALIIFTEQGDQIRYNHSDLQLKTSYSLPPEGGVDQIKLGPVRYELNLEGSYKTDS